MSVPGLLAAHNAGEQTPKRPRGRPPGSKSKPKVAMPVGTSTAQVVPGKKRGRPRKSLTPVSAVARSPVRSPAAPPAMPTPEPKKRGRPRKNPIAPPAAPAAAAAATADASGRPLGKRPVGRPRKNPSALPIAQLVSRSAGNQIGDPAAALSEPRPDPPPATKKSLSAGKPSKHARAAPANGIPGKRRKLAPATGTATATGTETGTAPGASPLSPRNPPSAGAGPSRQGARTELARRTAHTRTTPIWRRRRRRRARAATRGDAPAASRALLSRHFWTTASRPTWTTWARTWCATSRRWTPS